MKDEMFVSATLRLGVALAALASLVGAVWYFSQTRTVADYGIFRAARVTPGLSTGVGFLSLGVAILIATPIVRVAILVIVFLRERDWLYTGVSTFVLAVLLLGLRG